MSTPQDDGFDRPFRKDFRTGEITYGEPFSQEEQQRISRRTALYEIAEKLASGAELTADERVLAAATLRRDLAIEFYGRESGEDLEMRYQVARRESSRQTMITLHAIDLARDAQCREGVARASAVGRSLSRGKNQTDIAYALVAYFTACGMSAKRAIEKAAAMMQRPISNVQTLYYRRKKGHRKPGG
ncbi:MAG: hypothetical protein HY943_21165 [Gammaproteobacteria bacterium]|nr:hypothetical protein [Gammaproteobacteria bacterium]